MKIAFVQDIIQFSVPLGTTLIAETLRQGGHEVGLYVVENDLDKTLKELQDYKPDAVAFSVITGSHLEYIKIARIIKKKINIPIIWGGPHATFFPKIIEEVRGVNFIRGLKLKVDNTDFMSKLMKHKLLVVKASENCIRLFPSLLSTTEELDMGLEIIKNVCEEYKD